MDLNTLAPGSITNYTHAPGGVVNFRKEGEETLHLPILGYGTVLYVYELTDDPDRCHGLAVEPVVLFDERPLSASDVADETGTSWDMQGHKTTLAYTRR